MATDKEYEALRSRYNLAISQIRVLQEQLTTKEQQWSQRDAKRDIVEDHMRKLCEQILAKDKAEMVLGDNRTWNTFSTDELISKAIKSFKEYNHKRTELMINLMDQLERRGQEVESLQDQLTQMIASGNISAKSVEEAQQEYVEEKEKKDAIAKAPNATQKAIADGTVTAIIEDEEDYDEQEARVIQEAMEMAQRKKLTDSGIPIVRSKTKQAQMKATEEKAVAAVVDLQKTISQFDEVMWMILEVMGTMGLSRNPQIQAECTRRDARINNYRFASAKDKLVSMQVVDIDKASVPAIVGSAPILWKMTEIGKMVYKTKFGEEMVESEMDVIIKEHDNLTHGYGIILTGELLEQTGRYKSVSVYNRKNAIPVKIDGRDYKYIPDIVCEGRHREYMEYELGNTTQADFVMKCNKMCRVTNYLNFIGPNIDKVRDLKKQVAGWIQTRGVENLKRVVVRIGTPRNIAQEEAQWSVVFDLKKGAEPIINAV